MCSKINEEDIKSVARTSRCTFEPKFVTEFHRVNSLKVNFKVNEKISNLAIRKISWCVDQKVVGLLIKIQQKKGEKEKYY